MPGSMQPGPWRLHITARREATCECGYRYFQTAYAPDAEAAYGACAKCGMLHEAKLTPEEREALPPHPDVRAAHQERDADARRLAELVLRIRAAVRERGYLYVESSDLYRDLDAAEELAAAIDAAMAPDTQTEGDDAE